MAEVTREMIYQLALEVLDQADDLVASSTELLGEMRALNAEMFPARQKLRRDYGWLRPHDGEPEGSTFL